MAATHRKLCVTSCLMLVLVSYVHRASGLVHEINKSTITKFLQGKLLTLTFVDSPSSARSRILYPFFVTASQVFPHDPEIFFTRTQDLALIKTWEVFEFPTLIYHRFGFKEPQVLKIDISVDGIVDEIARILKGNFDGLTRTYSLQVNDFNVKELIIQPQQIVFMMVVDRGDSEEKELIERLAYAFRNDDEILFATLDVAIHRKLRDELFHTKETPVLMVFKQGEKDSPYRYGGYLSLEVLTTFVNEQTGIGRDVKGNLLPESGRFPDVDLIIERNLEEIMEGQIEKVREVIAQIEELQPKELGLRSELLEYYAYLLENIATGEGFENTIISNLQEIDGGLIRKEGLSNKQKDLATRKRHILAYLRKLTRDHFRDKKARQQETKETKDIIEHEEL